MDVIWIRFDLRLTDNPALYAGSEKPCALVFTADGVDLAAMGAASRVYLHHALQALQNDLKKIYGARLMIHASLDQALDLISRDSKIERVLWNRSYEPRMIHRDLRMEARLKERGITPGVCRGAVLFEPWEIKNKAGTPFKVFTPYYKTVLARGRPLDPLPKPRRVETPLPHEGKVESLRLLPEKPRWDLPMMRSWATSEGAIQAQWKAFQQEKIEDYSEARDIPALTGTSRLSPALHFGQISPRTLWAGTDNAVYLRQIVWREFAIYSLFHQPDMDRQPILKQFERFPWLDEPEHLRAWQEGRTGYPIVDAGMRELWQTGFMHNRVRMIVGSFLVKNLHINWTEGAAWFWDTLIDADLANNSMGWQWVAGCGIDPSPYFRIFNPMLQSEKFDPEGSYLKQWLPELKDVPKRFIHSPWRGPPIRNYPQPIVDFAESRQLALMFYDRIKVPY